MIISYSVLSNARYYPLLQKIGKKKVPSSFFTYNSKVCYHVNIRIINKMQKSAEKCTIIKRFDISYKIQPKYASVFTIIKL